MKSKPTYNELLKENESLRMRMIQAETEDKFNSFFESNKAIMLQIHTKTKQILKVNQAALNFYGYTENEILQLKISEINTLSPQEIEEKMRKAVKNKSSLLEFKQRLKNGSIKNVKVYSVSMTLGNDSLMVITVFDNTEHKKIEKDLKTKENYLTALNLASDTLSVDEKSFPVQRFTKILGEVAEASRTYVFKNHKSEYGELLMSQIAEYTSPHIKPEIDNPGLQNLSYSEWLPRWHELLSNGEIINGRIADFPASERRILDPQGIKAVLIIPIRIGKEFWGFIGFDNCANEDNWQNTEIEYLKAGAEKISIKIKSDRKQKGLENENKRFQLTMDSMDSSIYVADMQNYELLFMNKYLKNLVGDNVGKKCYQILQGEDKPCSFCSSHLLIDENGVPKDTYSWEFQNSITKRWYLLRDKAIVWDDNIQARLEIATDITERKEAEEALIQSEENFKLLFEKSPLGIFTATTEGQILQINQKALDMLDSPSVEHTKKINLLQFSPLVQNGYSKKFKECIKTKEVVELSMMYKSKGGKELFLSLFLVPLLLDNGEVGKVYSIILDISVQKQVEQDLIESNATKDKFFSIIAHDLRSPFNSMLGFSKLLNENFNKYSNDEKKKYIQYIHNGQTNAYKLLQNLLLWSRTQRDTITFKPESLNLLLLIENINNLFLQTAENKQIQLKNNVSDNIYVYSDLDMVSTIIRNLISNAVKFTPKGGNISVTADIINEKGQVKVCITDTGVGISRNIQNKLFDISENTCSVGTDGESGSGLGLILCKEFVEKNGGKIWVKSEVNKGTAFCFTMLLVVDSDVER